jgi:hypothetical protein
LVASPSRGSGEEKEDDDIEEEEEAPNAATDVVARTSRTARRITVAPEDEE